MTTKICTSCETEKQVTKFYKHAGGKFGVKSQCKVCVDKRNKGYRKNNPEVTREIGKRQEQRAEVKAYRSSYRKANRALFRHHSMKRYATKKFATPAWLTQEHLDQISAVYEHARDCEIVTGQPYHVDHVIPLQGKNVCGLHVPWNLQVLPADVNQSKSNKLDDPALYSQGFAGT